MRVTLFGASGLLGRDLVQQLTGEQLTALSSKDADLRDRARIRDVIHDSRPDWILLAAAYTDVDGCESNRDLAFAVNCEGAIHVADAARDAGSRLALPEHRLRFRRRQTRALRSRRSEKSDERLWREQSPRRRTSARDPARGLHSPHLMALRPRRQVFSRNHSEAGLQPSRDLRSRRPARQPNFHARSRLRASRTLPRRRPRHRARHQLRQLHLVRVRHRNRARLRPAHKSQTGDHRRIPPSSERPAYSVLSPDSLHAYNIHMPDWKDALRRYLDGTLAAVSVVT
jgi:hypothetical protein